MLIARSSHSDVIMSFCSSFTRSVRFLHAVQFVINAKVHVHVDGIRDRERDGVRCSILVGDDFLHKGGLRGAQGRPREAKGNSVNRRSRR